jgi:hypothetical protein
MISFKDDRIVFIVRGQLAEIGTIIQEFGCRAGEMYENSV